MSHQRWHTPANRKALTSMCNNHCGDVAFHQERHCRTARTSPHCSFLPISCGFPTDVTIPNVPPQLKQILSVLSGKSADSQHKGEPISAQAPQHSIGRHQVPSDAAPGHFTPAPSPKTTRLKSMLHRKNSANQLLCTPLTQRRVILYCNISIQMSCGHHQKSFWVFPRVATQAETTLTN